MSTTLLSNNLSLGLRQDGRRPHEIRLVSCELSVLKLSSSCNVSGSARFSLGNTQVIASVFGPKHPINYQARMSRLEASLTVHVTSCEFSEGEHKPAFKRRHSDKLLGETLLHTFEKIVLKKLYPRSSIEIVLEVLQNDGSLLSAAINCTTLALIDAGIALREYCVACSAGYLDGKRLPLLDLNTRELLGSKFGIGHSQASARKVDKHSFTNSELHGLHKKTNLNKKAKFVVGHSDAFGGDKENRNGKVNGNGHENVTTDKIDDTSNPEWLRSKETDMEIEMENKMDENMEVYEDGEMRSKDGDYFHGVLTLAMLPVCNKILSVQMKSIIDFEQMDLLLMHCQKGCKKIHAIMKQAVKRHVLQLMHRRKFLQC